MAKRRRATKAAPATSSQFTSNSEVIAAIVSMLAEIVAKLGLSSAVLTTEPAETILLEDETVKALLTELQTARYEVERAVDAVDARKRGGVAAVMDGLNMEGA